MRPSLSHAIALVLDERYRQVHSHGWTPEHDDTHTEEELLDAGISYATMASSVASTDATPAMWPPKWEWSPEGKEDMDTNLVKGIALLLAELERRCRRDRVDQERTPTDKTEVGVRDLRGMARHFIKLNPEAALDLAEDCIVFLYGDHDTNMLDSTKDVAPEMCDHACELLDTAAQHDLQARIEAYMSDHGDFERHGQLSAIRKAANWEAICEGRDLLAEIEKGEKKLTADLRKAIAAQVARFIENPGDYERRGDS